MVVGAKSKREKTTAAELPEEVLRREILTRLPMKSVGRFKSVSKSWLSLFSDPQFVKQHTLNTTQNPNDYDCLIAKKDDKIVILSRYQETSALVSAGSFSLIGSVRGLVCLSYNNKLSLWNPAIHQSKELSIPPRRPRHSWYAIGFGFDSVNENYKVVVLSSDLKFACVYYSNSDVWVDVSIPDNVFVSGGIMRYLSTIVKDCPYWTSVKYSHNGNKKAESYLSTVKFDTGSNEFEVLPKFNLDKTVFGERQNHAFGYEFVDMNDCPTLIVHNRNSIKCMLDLFSLEGEKEFGVWNKMQSIGPLDFCGRHVSVSQGFYGGEIVFHDLKMFYYYDRKTDTVNRLTTVPMVNRCRYTPSLVLLEGMKSIYLTTQTRRATVLCSRVPRKLINSLRN